MDQRETAKAIEVMQAFVDGKPVECLERFGGNKRWYPLDNANWNWHGFDYRVKPESREWWILPECSVVFSSQDDAKHFAAVNTRPVSTPVLVREVPE